MKFSTAGVASVGLLHLNFVTTCHENHSTEKCIECNCSDLIFFLNTLLKLLFQTLSTSLYLDIK